MDQRNEGEDHRSNPSTILIRFRTPDTADLKRVQFDALELIDATQAFHDNLEVRLELMGSDKGYTNTTTFTFELKDLRANVLLPLNAVYSRKHAMTEQAV